MKRLSWSVVWGLCAVNLFKFDSAICPENESLTMNCGCTGAFLLFDDEWGKYYCWPIYLVTFRPWECENSCPVSVGRVVRTQQLHVSGDLKFQEFNYWPEFVHFYVWEGKPSHIRDRRLNISLWSSEPFFSVSLGIIWFGGRITYCLFRPLPAPSSSAFRSVLGGNRLAAVCAAERSDSECPSEFQSG